MKLEEIAEIVGRVCRCDPDRATNAAAEIFEKVTAARCVLTETVGEASVTFSAPTVEELYGVADEYRRRYVDPGT
jgi:hypothetical protein